MRTTHKNLICTNCKRHPACCDSGWGHHFKKGEAIFCKKLPARKGQTAIRTLHYCDEIEMDDMILGTAQGTAEYGFQLRSYGKAAKVVSAPLRTNKENDG